MPSDKNYIVPSIGLYDYSLIVGFSSSKFQNYKDETLHLKEMLSSQKDNLVKKKIRLLLDEQDEETTKTNFDNFYNCNCIYLCFGEFDFLTLSIIEGFGMGSRLFSSTEYLSKKNEKKTIDKTYPFYTQVSLGALPKINGDFISEDVNTTEKNIEDFYKKYPYIAVIKLKLNDSLLFRYGNELTSFVLSEIKALNSLGKGGFLTIKSFSWNELMIVWFTEDIGQIDMKVVSNIRSWVMEKEPCVVKTSTTFGFNFSMFDAEFDKFGSSEGSKVNVTTTWRVCPARMKKADKILRDTWDDFEINCKSENITDKGVWISRGKGELTTIFKGISLFNFLKFYKGLLKLNDDTMASDDTKTTVFIRGYTSIDISDIERSRENINYPSNYWENYLVEERKKLLFSPEVLKKLKRNLKNLIVPHNTKDNIIRMFDFYNNGISDDILFSRFLELHPILYFLDGDIKFINGFFNLKLEEDHIIDWEDFEPRKELERLHRKLIPRMNIDDFGIDEEQVDLHNYFDELNFIVDGFYHAFQNRWNPSFITRELYDSNIYFVGGIHELVSSLEELYESACRVIGNRFSFIYVEGGGNFLLRKHTFKLNKSYLFMPELLTSVYIGEVMNQAHFKFSVLESHILFDSKSNKMKIENTDLYSYLFIFSRHNPLGEKNIKAGFRNNVFLRFRNSSHRFIDLGVINCELFEHVLMDIASYYLLYNQDFSLFDYWFWLTNFSNPFYYGAYDEGKLKKESSYHLLTSEFRRLLLRYLIFVRICRQEYYEQIKTKGSVTRKRFTNNNKRFFTKSEEGIEDNLNECLGFIDRFLFPKKRMKSNIFLNWSENVVDFVENKLGTDEENTTKSIFDEIDEQGASEDNYVNRFEKGNDLEFNFSENLSFDVKHFIACRAVSFCLLKSIYKINTINTLDIPLEDFILRRQISPNQNNSDDSHYFKQEILEVLADPEGGDFIVRPSTRRKVFLYRNLFYQYLIDLANKEKKHYLDTVVDADRLELNHL